MFLGIISIQLLSAFPNVNDDNIGINSIDSLFSRLFTIEEMSEMKSISDIAEVLALKGVKD